MHLPQIHEIQESLVMTWQSPLYAQEAMIPVPRKGNKIILGIVLPFKVLKDCQISAEC